MRPMNPFVIRTPRERAKTREANHDLPDYGGLEHEGSIGATVNRPGGNALSTRPRRWGCTHRALGCGLFRVPGGGGTATNLIRHPE